MIATVTDKSEWAIVIACCNLRVAEPFGRVSFEYRLSPLAHNACAQKEKRKDRQYLLREAINITTGIHTVPFPENASWRHTTRDLRLCVLGGTVDLVVDFSSYFPSRGC